MNRTSTCRTNLVYYILHKNIKARIVSYCRQTQEPRQKHQQWSLEKCVALLRLPKLYKALMSTLCCLLPGNKMMQSTPNTFQQLVQTEIQEHMVYLSTHWSGKGCIANIAIEPTNITVHHCFFTFPWSKPAKVVMKQRGMVNQ